MGVSLETLSVDCLIISDMRKCLRRAVDCREINELIRPCSEQRFNVVAPGLSLGSVLCEVYF